MYARNPLRTLYQTFVKTEEHWFGGQLSASQSDVALAMFWSTPIPGASNAQSWTSLISLSDPIDKIWNTFHKEVRYEIRRAERELIEFHSDVEYDSVAMAEFKEDYVKLQRFKNLPRLNAAKLSHLAETGLLKITATTLANGSRCSWHAYICANGRARLLYSISKFYSVHDAKERAAIGRANRYHHWRDIQAFKYSGFQYYDLGGVYVGSDADQLNVSKFKEGFGGTLCPMFTATIPLTPIGKIALTIRGVWKSLTKPPHTLETHH